MADEVELLEQCIEQLGQVTSTFRRKTSGIGPQLSNKKLILYCDKIRVITEGIRRQCAERSGSSSWKSWNTSKFRSLVDQVQEVRNDLDNVAADGQARQRIKNLWTHSSNSSLINITIVYLQDTTLLLQTILQVEHERHTLKAESTRLTRGHRQELEYAERSRILEMKEAQAKEYRRSLVEFVSMLELNRSIRPPLALTETPHNLLDGLYDASHILRHQRYKRLRGHATCQWFSKLDPYRRWADSSKPTPLWCRGGPGVGKSVIMSSIVDIMSSDDLSPGHVTSQALAYYYLGSGRVQCARDLLASLYYQLSKRRGEMSEDLRRLLKKHDPKVGLTYEALKQHFKALLDAEPRNNGCIIIDALDEENMIDPERFTDVLQTLQQYNCRLLIFSRSEWPSSVSQWPGLYTEISPISNRPGIREFVDTELSASMFIQDSCRDDPGLMAKMQSALADDADGRFLHCRLQLQSFLTQKTRGELKTKLEDLEDSSAFQRFDVVGDFVTSVLDQQGDAFKSDVAQRSLVWLCESRRPMSIMGLREALTIADREATAASGRSAHVNEDEMLAFEQVLEICQGLILGDEGSRTAVLAHHEVQMRIKQRGREYINARTFQLGIVCLSYLLLDDFKHGPCSSSSELRSRLSRRPFLEYAACSWMWHVDAHSPDNKTLDLLTRLNASHKHRAAASQVFLWFMNDVDQREATFDRQYAQCHKMSSLEMITQGQSPPSWVLELHDSPQTALGSPLGSPQSVGQDLIGTFVRYGEFQLEYLTRHDATSLRDTIIFYWIISDTNALAEFRPNTALLLQYAIQQGITDLVESVLAVSHQGIPEHVPILVMDDDGELITPLGAAMKRSEPKLSIVQTLLDAGLVDLDHGHTVLHLACQYGYADVVDLLLQYGAPLDGTDDPTIDPPLFVAVKAEKPNVNVVRTLLRYGASINHTYHSDKRTLLHHAVITHDLTLVRVLLMNGCDVELKDGEGRSARQCAESLDVQQLLDQWNRKIPLVQL